MMNDQAISQIVCAATRSNETQTAEVVNDPPRAALFNHDPLWEAEMSTRMNQIAYFDERALHYLALAREVNDIKLRETYECIARVFFSKAANADASVCWVDGLERPLH